MITGARLLSTYTERIHRAQEIWLKGGRIAAVRAAGTYKKSRFAGASARLYDVRGGIVALPDRAPRLPGGLDVARAALLLPAELAENRIANASFTSWRLTF